MGNSIGGNSKMKKILIIIILIIVIGFMFARVRVKKDKSMSVSNNNIQIENNIDNSNQNSNTQMERDKNRGNISEEEKDRIINEIKDSLDNTTDKKVLSVNGEKISEREIAYVNYQLNNSTVNKSGDLKDPVDEVIREYVICQDAKELGISLSEKEMEEIRKVVKDDESVKKQAEILNISYDEVRQMYIDGRVKIELEMKWTSKVVGQITKGTLNFDNELFKQKYQEYSESSDISVKEQLLSEMLEQYTKYLVEQSNVEYIN